MGVIVANYSVHPLDLYIWKSRKLLPDKSLDPAVSFLHAVGGGGEWSGGHHDSLGPWISLSAQTMSKLITIGPFGEGPG